MLGCQLCGHTSEKATAGKCDGVTCEWADLRILKFSPSGREGKNVIYRKPRSANQTETLPVIPQPFVLAHENLGCPDQSKTRVGGSAVCRSLLRYPTL